MRTAGGRRAGGSHNADSTHCMPSDDATSAGSDNASRCHPAHDRSERGAPATRSRHPGGAGRSEIVCDPGGTSRVRHGRARSLVLGFRLIWRHTTRKLKQTRNTASVPSCVCPTCDAKKRTDCTKLPRGYLSTPPRTAHDAPKIRARLWLSSGVKRRPLAEGPDKRASQTQLRARNHANPTQSVWRSFPVRNKKNFPCGRRGASGDARETKRGFELRARDDDRRAECEAGHDGIREDRTQDLHHASASWE